MVGSARMRSTTGALRNLSEQRVSVGYVYNKPWLANMAASKAVMGEIKKSFITKEGYYKLMDLSEYSRPNKVPYSVQQCHPVRVSFVTVKDQGGCNDRVAFNIGRELYFYIYKGVRKVSVKSKIYFDTARMDTSSCLLIAAPC